ncbi:bifunctional DNA-formamidopyrimidine glycosylase/DNA-(apurinic or apyrimidinic site) lyase [Mycoplasmopsis verecunda]|uniref:DNA-(Apurinic or apyrimidinic site) lyase n=1 Tax=Mycoplasmopsis verecunda TaxID=171291 RepID=A0A1T4KNC6_9BACT|nr:bifunctional DNA-formamidopyrimidine glycosylase/DNA-(apurinic or apyrimidinic site) lyase [Mycoplasmopsis verecunda]WPB54308.1 bifunctional DNA-formamidopyrimidine glycosylase/DNA-(apurinic or apyrimidinic site) lyase [Mycoplasmopsis verecunda]SJZ43873.1 DNA-(apurinic or apyrimidinic site) lyase [Mycoplasmopsis verecunda]
MPEYPEVTVVTNTLNSLVSNCKITNVNIIKEKLIKNATAEEFKNFLINKIILNVKNYGKFIVFTFNDNSRMISHLRMSGKYFVWNPSNDNYFLSQTHNYMIFDLLNIYNKPLKLIYNDSRMFGSFEIIPANDNRDIYQIKNLGKLPLDVDVQALFNKIQKKNISIKSILLDQSLVLGIGNIYADEALHKAKINPMIKCNKITLHQLEELLQYAGEIMNNSIKMGGSSVHTYTSVNSQKGTYQNELKVYGKCGKLCSTCKKSKIKKVKLDYKQNGRGTSFCPNCQPEENE